MSGIAERRQAQSPPIGTLTLLLTDVEGSTRLWEELADAMRSAIRRHHELAFETIERHAGYRPPDQGEGDSVFAVFVDPSSAVACALDLQRALAREPWPEGAELRVRMALHTGYLELRDGRNYAGVSLSRCARLRALVHGGQTVLSEATRVLVGSDLPPGTSLKDLGLHRLKDLSAPEHVFQLVHPDLPADFPALRSLDARPHNLQVQLTRFVGRERELAEAASLLDKTRLLTLTGTGGGGKTRLALQLAADLLDTYPDGVWLAELAPVSDAALVPRVVASAIGVREHHGRRIPDALVDHLSTTVTLIVLDNCEHVIDACAELAERVLSACPNVTILATSREPLTVPGETLWRVPSLSLPKRGEGIEPQALADSDSVQLFLDRAAAADPQFSLVAANAASVEAVCRRLEGIPLAIELAAAGLRAFTIEQVAHRLETQFRLAGQAARTTPARHQTLTATVDWSHDLLTESERGLFRRLSIFAGGFTASAAGSVCGGEGVERDALLDLLAQLVLKSLVLRESNAGEGRYRLQEVIRQYALERLREAGEEDRLRSSHLEWCISFAELLQPELRGHEQHDWLDRLHAELDNFRAALDWSLAHDDAEAGLRLAVALHEFWMVRADWSEGRHWIERALDLTPEVEPGRQIKALGAAGELADALSDYPGATRHFQASLDLARAFGDQRGIANALMGLAHEAERVGKFASARPLIEESVAIYRELGDDPGLARSLGGLAWLENDYRRAGALQRENLAIRRRLGNPESVGWSLLQVGFSAQCMGDYAAARAAYGEALEIARDLGYQRMNARSLTQLGELALLEGRTREARSHFDESLPIWHEIGHKSGLLDCLRGLGSVGQVEGDVTAAASLLQESLDVCREIGARPGEAAALDALGALACSTGDLDRAERLVEEALALWMEMDDFAGRATSIQQLGEIAAERGALEDAVRLLADAGALRGQVGAAISPLARPEYERALAAVRAGLGSEEFARMWNRSPR